MKKFFAILCCLGLFGLSCKKNKDGKAIVPDGTYAGTFQRMDASGNGVVARVSIQFSGNQWNGQSETDGYPVICNGTFRAGENSQVIFDDQCRYTANFDWTLILSKEYQLTVTGSILQIKRTYNGGSQDVYTLSRQ